MPSISPDTRVIFWIVAAVAGAIFAIFGNELGKNIIYFFSRRGRPPTQRPLHIWLIFLVSVSFSIIFGALAGFAPSETQVILTPTPTSEPVAMDIAQLKQSGAYVHILSIVPDPKTTVFHPGDDFTVVIAFEYNLPGRTPQPSVQLKYLRSAGSIFSWTIIQQQVAQVGVHKLQLSGQFQAPEISALNGEPFQIAIEMMMLDEGMGRINSVAMDKVTFNLETAK